MGHGNEQKERNNSPWQMVILSEERSQRHGYTVIKIAGNITKKGLETGPE